jgi:hypothetical protein
MSCLGGNIARFHQLDTLKNERHHYTNGAQSMTKEEKSMSTAGSEITQPEYPSTNERNN